MKCKFKTNKILTAVKETKHTVTTSEGKTIHKKLASKPIKFQLPKKSEGKRKPTNRCIGCGKFSQGDYCDTHKRVYGVHKDTDEPSSSYTLPTMPQKRSTYVDIITTATETNSPTAEGEEQQTHATIAVTEAPCDSRPRPKKTRTERTHHYHPRRYNAVLVTVHAQHNHKTDYRRRYAQPKAPR